MNKDFCIPPKNKDSLTSPEVLAKRLSVLIDAPFHLTRKTRTDGSTARKLIANTLEQYPLPPVGPINSYTIVPPKKKGVPRILLEYIDTYIVTTGDSYNLQVWNRNPAGSSVQVEYASGEKLSAKDVRFVFLRVNPHTEKIESILILSPEYIERNFGRFGKPTIKHQLIITPKTRESILKNNPPLIFYPDTLAIAMNAQYMYKTPQGSIRDKPVIGYIMSLEVLRDRLVSQIIGAKLDKVPTKNRGQALEILVARQLGYTPSKNELLSGGYPDIRNQALEVKVQDSPTIDLGMFSPQFEESVPSCPGITTLDIRYLITLTDKETSTVRGAILCPGSRLGEHGSYVSNVSYKCQRSIPMKFFDRHRGQALFNP
jgi:hypothetical protein